MAVLTALVPQVPVARHAMWVPVLQVFDDDKLLYLTVVRGLFRLATCRTLRPSIADWTRSQHAYLSAETIGALKTLREAVAAAVM